MDKVINDVSFRFAENEDRFWYLCTSYSKYPKGMEQAYLDACAHQAELMKAGIFVYCPISHNHEAGKIINNLSHDFWLPIDFKFVRLSRGLLVSKMENWENSYGIGEEIKLATRLEKPIIYLDFMEVPNFA